MSVQHAAMRAMLDQAVPGGLLVQEVDSGPYRRVYRLDDRVCKVQLADLQAIDRHDTLPLKGEYEALLACQRSRRIPQVLGYTRDEKVERLDMEAIDGETLERSTVSLPRTIRIAWSVGCTLGVMSIYGLVHKDVVSRNILLAHDGRVVLVDFGHASRTGRLAAFYHNFLALPHTRSPSQGGNRNFLHFVQDHLLRRLPTPLQLVFKPRTICQRLWGRRRLTNQR
ncbi:MAG: protein kinase [Phycisphaeraceae bacterium]